jgi:O-antigen ligase
VPVLWLAFGQGGYFATAWGWAAVGFLWVAAIALVLRRTMSAGWLDVLFVGGLAALATWMLVSSAWSVAPSESVLDAQRALVYVAAGAALVIVADRRSVDALLGGLLAAVVLVCAYALTTRLFPEFDSGARPLGSYRLAEPLGYWNALGLLAAMGTVLAIALAATARSRAARALVGALPVVLLPTLYLTFGRAAWLSLAAGLAATLVVARGRRLSTVAVMVVVGPGSAVVVAVAARSPALTAAGAPAAEITADGWRLAAAIVALCGLVGIGTLSLPWVTATLGRLTLPRAHAAIAGASLAAVLAGAVAVGIAAGGGPGRLLDRAGRSISAPPAPIEGQRRLLTVQGQGRAAVWRVAWDAARSRPVVGIGAGGFGQRWLAARRQPFAFRDAHNLYLETLAELGVVGLALLLAAFAAPALAAWRARAHPLAPAATGGLVAYLAHAALDWDWEMPAVTIAALVCAVAALALARPPLARAPRWPARAAGLAVAAALAALAVVGLVGNGAVGASVAALRAGHPAAVEREAIRASRWAPWSGEPWRWIGEARLARGDSAGARRAFAAAVRREPRNWTFWYGLAVASDGAARSTALSHASALNPLSDEVRALNDRRGG